MRVEVRTVGGGLSSQLQPQPSRPRVCAVQRHKVSVNSGTAAKQRAALVGATHRSRSVMRRIASSFLFSHVDSNWRCVTSFTRLRCAARRASSALALAKRESASVCARPPRSDISLSLSLFQTRFRERTRNFAPPKGSTRVSYPHTTHDHILGAMHLGAT
jgi:hypothetical protein